jgi:hypothetical protein
MSAAPSGSQPEFNPEGYHLRRPLRRKDKTSAHLETHFYRPARTALLRIVNIAKRLQSGRLDAYIAYMLIALVAVLAIVAGLG